jgi:hypothetical protein
VNYSVNKAKSEPFPTSVNVTIYAVDLLDGPLPDVFHIECVDDDGIVQKRTHILNCSQKQELAEYVVAVATVP